MSKNVQQMLLNKSYLHIINQGKASLNDAGICVYQALDGSGCAASPFITKYDERMENLTWATLTYRFPDNVIREAKVEASFVYNLQRAHDSNRGADPQDFIERYKSSIKKIALDYELIVPGAKNLDDLSVENISEVLTKALTMLTDDKDFASAESILQVLQKRREAAVGDYQC